MSKGIGNGYINRMKRFHLPYVKSVPERVSKIVDRAFYYDGAFKYKLPRYYRDRFYRKRFPYETLVWNKKKKCYENKIVWRYASKNILSLQMQAEIRNRILAEYHKRFGELKSKFPNKSDDEIDFILLRSEEASRVSRRKDINSKMSRFYNSQRFKNRKF